MVPVAAGGTNDVTARMIAQKLSEAWGQQVYVDNVPGGGENIGIGQVAKAEPNGYTVLFATGALHAQSEPATARCLTTRYKDFTPVTLVASGPHVLTVHPSVPAKNVQELVALREGQSRQVQLRVVGRRTRSRVSSGELFKLKFELDTGARAVQRRRARPSTSTIGGHTPIAFTSLPQRRARTSRTASCARSASTSKPRVWRNSRTCRPWRKPACRSW